ncbi:hypothetical protein ACFOQM_20610 [Paenibacillus sp. GCM10012307]|uniref:PhiEco32-like amidoligase-type 2 protein n=2 Tax=Paenibacillus TaxID=44249 RepID=A0A934J2L3_9BACL|nr:hypothetical protein [Paenibacillus roseus]MBJ6363631.1 hypothetical protein [Paenibacillus roseus]
MGGVWIWNGSTLNQLHRVAEHQSRFTSPSASVAASHLRESAAQAANRTGAGVFGDSRERVERYAVANQRAIIYWPEYEVQAGELKRNKEELVYYGNLREHAGKCPSLPDPHKPGSLPGHIWLLNEGVCRLSVMTKTGLQMRLGKAGVRWLDNIGNGAGRPDSGESVYRFFRVAVFHLEVLELERVHLPARSLRDMAGLSPSASAMAGSGSLGSIAGAAAAPAGLGPEDPLYRRVARTAVRALYALGLDLGEVVVALNDDGRTAVSSVIVPPPDARGGLWLAAAERFAAACAAAEEAAAAQGPLLIGADPEFVLLREDGRIVSAARYLDPHGRIGCDAVPVGRRLHYPVAELRPAPETTPAALAASLQHLLHQAAARISGKGLRWLAGGMPVPGLALGGHIHLSGVPLTSLLLRALDSCVAFPLALVESAGSRARRPRYGWLGDYRLQPHGGFEYRTPPSWLISPAAAKAVFAFALLAALEYRTLGCATDSLPAAREELVHAYYSGDRKMLAEGMEPFFERIAQTASYPSLAEWMEPLLRAIRRGEEWDESRDIRVKWRIPLR